MKTELPSAEEFVKEEIGWTPPKVRKVMQKYGTLCAKYGAKSIRNQSIEMILDKMLKADNQLFNMIGEELINDIQNLNP